MNDLLLSKAKDRYGNWIEGYVFKTAQGIFISIVDGIKFIEVDPDTVCRTTPWKYKNGKPIYENDICFYEEEEDTGDIRHYGVFLWIDEWAGFFFLLDYEYDDYIASGVYALDSGNEFTMQNEHFFEAEKTNMIKFGTVIDNKKNISNRNYH